MPTTDSALTNDQRTVREGSTPDYQFQLRDQDDANLAKANLATATLRVVNAKDGATIVASASVLADISTTGLYAAILPATMTNFQDSTLEMGAVEVHYLIYEWTFPATPTRTGVFVCALRCERAHE